MLDNSTNNDHLSNDLISFGATFSDLTVDTITSNTQQLEISPLLALVTVVNVKQEVDHDFNGDGTSDLLWRQTTTGATSAWLLNSSGKRQSSVNYGSVPGWDIEQTGDFNGDGTSDLLWRQTTTGATGAWLLNSSGKRQSSVNYGSVPGWDIEQTGDFNGDGTSDLLWRQPKTGATGAWLLNSSGKRQSSVNYGSVPGWDIEPQPQSQSQITVTSPNGGNKLTPGTNVNITWTDNINENVNIDLYRDDVSVQTVSSNTASDGQAAWTVPTNLPLSDRYRIKVSKFGNSNIGDLSDNYFSIYQPKITLTSPNGGNKLAPGGNVNITWTDNISENVNIDLYRDDVFVQTVSSNTASDGQAAWTVPTNLPLSDRYKLKVSKFGDSSIGDLSDSYFSVYQPVPKVVHKVDDFNGDGKHDILWRQLNNGVYHAWTMDGLNTLYGINLEGIEDAADTAWHPVALGDFNSDGNTDIVARYQWNNNSGFNRIWLMNKNQKIGQIELPRESNLNWNVGGTGDFNQDGSLDILWRNHQTGENNVWLMNGTERMGNVALKNEANPNLKIAGTGDFNKDGNIDILWRNYQTGENNVWLMNGTNYSQNAGIMTVPDLDWQIVGTADFNQDSNIDILFRHLPTGENHVWLMNGTNLAESKQITIVPGKEWHIVGGVDTIPTWTAEYFNNKTLSGTPVHTEGVGTSYSSNSYGELALNWGLGSPKNTPADGFSARIKTKRYLAPGLYQIQTGADDGIRVIIDGQKVTDRWGFSSGDSGYFYSDGKEHNIQVEYYEEGGGASLDFKINKATQINEPVNESQQWTSRIYNWNPTQGSQPPQDFFIDNAKFIGTVGLGSNIRSDGKFGINVNWQEGAIKGDKRLPHDNFAIRSYTHKLLEAGKTYRATVTGDDGFQLFAKQWYTNNVVDLLSNRRQVPTTWTQNYPSQGAKTYEFTVDNSGWYDLAFQMFEVNSPSNFDFALEEKTVTPPPSNTFQLPYPDGVSYTVTEGNQNGNNHSDNYNKYAWDFNMPEGSTVVATKSGVIRSMYEGSNQHTSNVAGSQALNNYVVIDHKDGTSSLYSHLQFNSVEVNVGDTVSQNQPIAKSGYTGYAFGAHLHYSLQKTPGDSNYGNGSYGYWQESIPSSFSDPDVLSQNSNGVPIAGRTYRS